ncbi:MAG: hypothetical protein K2Q14_01175 [Gammaproteobacteria bacterium]|nr:hypothetical protein [Gammaproteobacteria bacterium]
MNTSALETMVLKDWLIDVMAGNCPADLSPGITEGIAAHYEDDIIKIKRIKSGHRFSLVTVPIDYLEDTINYNSAIGLTPSHEAKLAKPLQKIIDLLSESGEHTLFNKASIFAE